AVTGGLRMVRNAVTVPALTVAAPVTQAGEGYWQIAWRRLRRHRLAMGGLLIIALLVATAVFAPWIAPYKFEQIDLLNRFGKPLAPRHLLGTDDLGHDVLTRLLFAGRASFSGICCPTPWRRLSWLPRSTWAGPSSLRRRSRTLGSAFSPRPRRGATCSKTRKATCGRRHGSRSGRGR